MSLVTCRIHPNCLTCCDVLTVTPASCCETCSIPFSRAMRGDRPESTHDPCLMTGRSHLSNYRDRASRSSVTSAVRDTRHISVLPRRRAMFAACPIPNPRGMDQERRSDPDCLTAREERARPVGRALSSSSVCPRKCLRWRTLWTSDQNPLRAASAAATESPINRFWLSVSPGARSFGASPP